MNGDSLKRSLNVNILEDSLHQHAEQSNHFVCLVALFYSVKAQLLTFYSNSRVLLWVVKVFSANYDN